ncbi:hypothetical protein POX_b03130 [Penicillium oxalicum]|uniref:hypothetical protein n=1 Tax=Penicillium oxalicum TaxID=69781 RepID=UPI0020B685AE|nr:hypothetical protein POX_b03130 [Penicillium oxalicum]KAI2793083.1 hypothetical protein POX_b03130 [Penicillium oxalicum]
MALRWSAEQAARAADGFSVLRAPLPQHATEITSLISDFYGISASLLNLDELTKDVRYRRAWSLVQPDAEILRSSLGYTVQDALDFLNRLNGGQVTADTYRRTWQSIDQFFWKEAQYSLSTRLAKYKGFLREIIDLLKDPRHESFLLAASRDGMKSLLAVQEQRILPQLGRMSLERNPPSTGSASTGTDQSKARRGRQTPYRKKSYERSRPTQFSPQYPLSPSDTSFSDFPPTVPEVPSSPLESVSATGTSRSTHSDVTRDHWIKEIFTTFETMTPIPRGRERAGCFGEPRPDIKQWLREQGYDLLLQLEFKDETNMTVYFYLREQDHRARIMCKLPHRSRSSEYFCLPLNLLEIVREGSCLQLCRRRHGGSELVLWASILFPNIEMMVAFFTTFIGLRSQDAGHPVDDIRDHELDGERELYGGQIIDDDFVYALRVYRDKLSKAVRIQTSVHKGEMDRTPVWTAFITEHLTRRSWLRSLDDQTVVVRDLKPIVLMSDEEYTFTMTKRGDHI